MEEMIKLKCECGVEFERPQKYVVSNRLFSFRLFFKNTPPFRTRTIDRSWTGIGDPYSHCTKATKSRNVFLFYLTPPIIRLFYYWCFHKVMLVKKSYMMSNVNNNKYDLNLKVHLQPIQR